MLSKDVSELTVEAMLSKDVSELTVEELKQAVNEILQYDDGGILHDGICSKLINKIKNKVSISHRYPLVKLFIMDRVAKEWLSDNEKY